MIWRAFFQSPTGPEGTRDSSVLNIASGIFIRIFTLSLKKIRTHSPSFTANFFLLMLLSAAVHAQQPAQPQQPQDIPSVNGESGPCSVELTVVDADGNPVFSALVKVHIAYGFGGFHKLDLSVYTNAQGKTRFTGLPARVRKPPVEFRATKGPLTGVATVDPEADCQAKHDIIVKKQGA